VDGHCELDGHQVDRISAYLFHAGGHDDPVKLTENTQKSFQGCVVVGMGFTFDDTVSDGTTTPIRKMHELIANDRRNAERIFPYIGGEEVNDSPTQSFHRYIINFGDLNEDQARTWPDLMKIVEDKVKPERTRRDGPWSMDKEKRAQRWWQFSRTAKELYAAIESRDRVLVLSRVGNAFAFAFLTSKTVFSDRLVVFAFSSFAAFASLQSRSHEVWSRFNGSSLKDDLLYTSSDCFETFPFPENFATDAKLESVGKEYYKFRAALMAKNNEGLTKTYNRFHDRDHDVTERDREIVACIQKLRELHAAMDRAVLDAYGWTDLKPTCEFLLDYKEEDEEDDTGQARKKKKPWRYRWPDETRDEVLARLLELNKQRAEQERLSGEAAEAGTKKIAQRTRNTTPARDNQNRLPGM